MSVLVTMTLLPVPLSNWGYRRRKWQASFVGTYTFLARVPPSGGNLPRCTTEIYLDIAENPNDMCKNAVSDV